MYYLCNICATIETIGIPCHTGPHCSWQDSKLGETLSDPYALAAYTAYYGTV